MGGLNKELTRVREHRFSSFLDALKECSLEQGLPTGVLTLTLPVQSLLQRLNISSSATLPSDSWDDLYANAQLDARENHVYYTENPNAHGLRIALAHELGHWLLADFPLVEGRSWQRPTLFDILNPSLGQFSLLEWPAHQLAYHITMPLPLLHLLLYHWPPSTTAAYLGVDPFFLLQHCLMSSHVRCQHVYYGHPDKRLLFVMTRMPITTDEARRTFQEVAANPHTVERGALSDSLLVLLTHDSFFHIRLTLEDRDSTYEHTLGNSAVAKAAALALKSPGKPVRTVTSPEGRLLQVIPIIPDAHVRALCLSEVFEDDPAWRTAWLRFHCPRGIIYPTWRSPDSHVCASAATGTIYLNELRKLLCLPKRPYEYALCFRHPQHDKWSRFPDHHRYCSVLGHSQEHQHATTLDTDEPPAARSLPPIPFVPLP